LDGDVKKVGRGCGRSKN